MKMIDNLRQKRKDREIKKLHESDYKKFKSETNAIRATPIKENEESKKVAIRLKNDIEAKQKVNSLEVMNGFKTVKIKDLDIERYNDSTQFKLGDRALFRDHGNHISVSNSNTDDELSVTLAYAVNRFGSNLDIQGTPEFKRGIVKAAAEQNLNISFVDSEMTSLLAEMRGLQNEQEATATPQGAAADTQAAATPQGAAADTQATATPQGAAADTQATATPQKTLAKQNLVFVVQEADNKQSFTDIRDAFLKFNEQTESKEKKLLLTVEGENSNIELISSSESLPLFSEKFGLSYIQQKSKEYSRSLETNIDFSSVEKTKNNLNNVITNYLEDKKFMLENDRIVSDAVLNLKPLDSLPSDINRDYRICYMYSEKMNGKISSISNQSASVGLTAEEKRNANKLLKHANELLLVANITKIENGGLNNSHLNELGLTNAQSTALVAGKTLSLIPISLANDVELTSMYVEGVSQAIKESNGDKEVKEKGNLLIENANSALLEGINPNSHESSMSDSYSM